MKAEAHRIACTEGHTVAMTKSGEEDVETSTIRYYGKCIYCGATLEAHPASLDDYEHWSSRVDGRYRGNGAP